MPKPSPFSQGIDALQILTEGFFLISHRENVTGKFLDPQGESGGNVEKIELRNPLLEEMLVVLTLIA
jgi:hypothetical protein